MERKNKASLSRNLLFPERKGRNFGKPAGRGLAVFFLEYTFVYRMKKHSLPV